MELEENLQGKDLTAYERSKTLVSLAETAAEADRGSFVQTLYETPGRPESPGSLRRVSECISIPVPTIHLAQQHVAAVEEFPGLALSLAAEDPHPPGPPLLRERLFFALYAPRSDGGALHGLVGPRRGRHDGWQLALRGLQKDMQLIDLSLIPGAHLAYLIVTGGEALLEIRQLPRERVRHHRAARETDGTGWRNRAVACGVRRM